MGRHHLHRLEERSVILSGIADTDDLQVHSSFLQSAHALAASPPMTISAIDVAFMQPLPARGPASTATYKPTVRSEIELLLQHFSRPKKLPVRYDKMAFSCSTSFVASPISTKFVTYVPPTSKPKPKPKPTPKAKSMATTKTAGHSRSGIDSKDNGEWFHIDDDFTMPDSNASRPTLYEATDASHSMGYGDDRSLIVANQRNPTSTGLVDAFTGFRGGCELENPEHDQFGEESLDKGQPDHPARVTERDPAMIGLLSGVGREFPLIVEGDAAEGHHSETGVKPSNVASDCQESDYRASAGNEEYVAVQYSDLNTDEVRAFSMEEIESVRPNRPLAQDEPLFGDGDVTDRPSTTRKRARLDTPNVTPDPELEDPHSSKRRGPVERLVESLVRNPVPTPKSTPLPTPSGSVSHSRASTERSLRSLDSDGKHDGARSPRSSPSDFHTEDDSGYSKHSRRASQGLLHSSRGSVSSLEGIAGEQYIDSNSERRGENGECSGGEFGESHDELNQDDALFPRSSTKASQRRKHSNRPLKEKKHRPLQTTLGRRCSSKMPTRASRQGTSSQPQLLYRPPIDIRPRSCSPQAPSPGTKAGDETSINHKPNVDMPYQITDLTLCAVPHGLSIVTAVVRYPDLKWPLDPAAALSPKFLGENGKVIRTTQLSPDSWMLLGYRYDDDDLGLSTCGNSNADRMSCSRIDAANQESDHLEDDSDEGENEEEDIEKYSQRTHKRWLKSDDARLLSYKDKQGMKWEQIFNRFPERSSSAVQQRYTILRKKGQ